MKENNGVFGNCTVETQVQGNCKCKLERQHDNRASKDELILADTRVDMQKNGEDTLADWCPET